MAEQGSTTGKLADRVFRLRTHDDAALDLGTSTADGDTWPAEPELVLIASGNLSMIYFTRRHGRLTAEDVEQLYPGLVAALTTHPGIGFIVVRTSDRGTVVLGKQGIRYLATDRVDGVDPLEHFGPQAVADVRRHEALDNVGDLIINSPIDAGTGEVAAYEELVGCHGGLGRWQSDAVLVHPAGWVLQSAPLIGATRFTISWSGGWRSWGSAVISGPPVTRGASSAPFVGQLAEQLHGFALVRGERAVVAVPGQRPGGAPGQPSLQRRIQHPIVGADDIRTGDGAPGRAGRPFVPGCHQLWNQARTARCLLRAVQVGEEQSGGGVRIDGGAAVRARHHARAEFGGSAGQQGEAVLVGVRHDRRQIHQVRDQLGIQPGDHRAPVGVPAGDDRAEFGDRVQSPLRGRRVAGQ
jgi:hypothetical protein